MTNEAPTLTTFETKPPTLQEAQDIVGGYVEMTYSATQPDVQILINEDGISLALGANPAATILCGKPIVGNVVVLKEAALWD